MFEEKLGVYPSSAVVLLDHDNKIPVIILNTKASPVKLYAGMTIGYVELINKEHIFAVRHGAENIPLLLGDVTRCNAMGKNQRPSKSAGM